MTNSEKVLAYLEDSMSASERITFESELAGNKELQSELAFQEGVIDAIKLARKTELKALLNQIEIGGSSTSQLTKVVSSVVVVGLISLGVYFLWPENTTSLPSAINNHEAISSNETDNQLNETEKIIDNEISSDESGTNLETENIPDLSEVPEKKKLSEEKSNKIVNEISPQIEVPNGIDGIVNEEDDDLNIPESGLTDNLNPEESISIEVITSDKKHSFHYQFKGNSLILFGDFTETYEILDFHKDSKRALYLYYTGNYYPLLIEENKVTPLEKVTDKTLISNLETIRNKP